MRVITPFGLGRTIEEEGNKSATVKVELDRKFTADKILPLNRRAEVFPFTDWAVARVLNIEGQGWFSNLQFHTSSIDARIRLLLPTPPDETAFLLDIKSGNVNISQELGFMAQDYLLMRPWLDRWGSERTSTFDTKREAEKNIDKEVEELAGSTGISTIFLINVQKRRLLCFHVVVMSPQGVVFSKEY